MHILVMVFILIKNEQTKNKMSKQNQLNLFAYFVILCLMKGVKNDVKRRVD